MSGVPAVAATILRGLFPLLAVFAVAATVGIAWVVFRDAQLRGISEATATIWGLGVAVLFPVAAPVYFHLVVRSRKRARAVTVREQWVGWLSMSFGCSFVVTAIATPPDPFTQALAQLVLLPLVAIGTYLLVNRTSDQFSFDEPT